MPPWSPTMPAFVEDGQWILDLLIDQRWPTMTNVAQCSVMLIDRGNLWQFVKPSQWFDLNPSWQEDQEVSMTFLNSPLSSLSFTLIGRDISQRAGWPPAAGNRSWKQRCWWYLDLRRVENSRARHISWMIGAPCTQNGVRWRRYETLFPQSIQCFYPLLPGNYNIRLSLYIDLQKYPALWSSTFSACCIMQAAPRFGDLVPLYLRWLFDLVPWLAQGRAWK